MKPQKLVLLLESIVLIVSAILLQNSGLLPLDAPTFLFFSFVLLLFALYRLGLAFLLVVALVPLEVINVAPAFLGGLALRPYQWLTAIIFSALALRVLFGRLPFQLFRPLWFDALPVLVALGGYSALLGAHDMGPSLKQALVVTSFVAFYFLGRIFFRTLYDVCQALPFFLTSSLIVFGYALWQNIRFRFGEESFQVMVGRPNATFSEADWLGLFGVLVFGVTVSLFTSLLLFRGEPVRFSWKEKGLVGIALGAILSFVLLILILTMARSAWLGLGMLVLTAFLLILVRSGGRSWLAIQRSLLGGIVFSGVVLLCAVVALVTFLYFRLSPFPLFERIQSTGGLQTITIACDTPVALPRIIAVAELPIYNCRHINLEAIDTEKEAGKFVTEVTRPDPNIAIRQDIYSRVMTTLRTHFLLGIGWGGIGTILGTDERGVGLNASNIFLEVWLGSGLMGLIAFTLFFGLVLFTALVWYVKSKRTEEKTLAFFLVVTGLGMMIFNLFNSGILLGFFFLFLSVGALALEWYVKQRVTSEEMSM